MSLAADLALRRSPILVALVAAMWLGTTAGCVTWLQALESADQAGAAPWVLLVPLLLWISSCVIICSWWRSTRIRGVSLGPDGMTVQLVTPRFTASCRPMPGGVVWPGIMSVPLAPAGADTCPAGTPRILLVPADSLTPAGRRMLARWLHWLRRVRPAPADADATGAPPAYSSRLEWDTACRVPGLDRNDRTE